jgi:nickel superoxide dismutase
MQKLTLVIAALALASVAMTPLTNAISAPAPTPAPIPHCEVPCGIYADQHRFEEMLEDTATITKAIDQINELAAKNDGQSVNQAVRWVTTKEAHATNTQHIVSQYFLTQRIKADKPRYADQLASAHGVMVAAMKCKQGTNPESGAALKAAILKLHKAYTGEDHKPHTHK